MESKKSFKKYLERNKFTIVVIVISSIIATIFTLVTPVLVGNVIKEITNLDKTHLLKESILIVCMYLGIFILDSISVTYSSRLSSRVGKDIREDLFNKLHKLPIFYIDKNSHGEIINNFSYDVENICLAIIQIFSKSVVGIVTIIGAIIIMLKLNIIMAIITILSSIVMYFISKFIVNSTKKMFKIRAELVSKMNGYAIEAIISNKTIKDFNYKEIVENKFSKMNEELYITGKKAQFYSSLTNPCTRLVNNLTYIIIGIVGIILTKKGQIDLGIVTSFLMYVSIFARPFNEITGVMSELQIAIASKKKIQEFLESKDEVKEKKASNIKEIKGNIDFINVDFSYDENVKFIKNMNLSVKQGESIAIVGKTGVGKTSIVNLIMKFYNINKGKILIDGININDIPLEILRKNIGIVLQDTKLFTGTIKENIEYGRKDVADEEIKNAAKLSRSRYFYK